MNLRVRRVGEIVQFGIEREELRADTDPAFLQELLFGPVYTACCSLVGRSTPTSASASSTLSCQPSPPDTLVPNVPWRQRPEMVSVFTIDRWRPSHRSAPSRGGLGRFGKDPFRGIRGG